VEDKIFNMARQKTSIITMQPIKAVWTVAAASLTLVKLPFWLLYFLPRRFRQHPQRTYRQAIMNEVCRAILYHTSRVEVRTPVQLDEKDSRFVKIHPAKQEEVYHGLLNDAEVQPTVTGGTWYPSLYQAADEDTVVLHLHGGAYVTVQGRPTDIDFLATTLVKNLKAKAFLLSYRLSCNEGCHFPAALQDAVTAYQYLLDQGIPPNRIVLSGDSAGGSLAVSLLRHINQDDVKLPPPCAAFLFSPWLDLKSAREPDYLIHNKNYRTDYVTSNYTGWGARRYIPAHMNPNNPHFSPIAHPFLTKTPLLIHLGGLEVLYDEVMEFADAMKKEGNKVELYVEPVANHDVVLFGNLTGFEAEAARAVQIAGEFLNRNRDEE
jgi:acetyl esterase/lipase